MTDRRRGASYYQGGPDYQRVMQRIDEGMGALTERLEASWDRVDKRMARMENDIAAGAEGRANLASDLAELRRDLGDLRDTVSLADHGKTEAAGVVAATVTKPRSRWEKAIAAAVGFTAFMVAVDNIPDAARGVEHVWAVLVNRPATEEKAKEAETDGR